MKTVIFATSNKDKVREINEIVKEANIKVEQVLTSAEVGFTDEVDETGTTFEENATIKAKAVYDYVLTNKKEYADAIVLADDSGLEIDYYDKAPGVYSHRWLGNKTYPEKMQEVLDDMKNVPDEKRGARFVCSMAAFNEGKLFVTRQTVEGQVGYEIIGENGFGYDPFFYMKEYGCTTAQMPPEKKNEISHRGKALRAIFSNLKNGGVL